MFFNGTTFPIFTSALVPIATFSPTLTPSGACNKTRLPSSYSTCARGALWPWQCIKSIIFPVNVVSLLYPLYSLRPLYLKLGGLYLGPPLPLACCIKFLHILKTSH